MWWGQASTHFAEKRQQLEDLLEDEQHPVVREWLNFYIRNLGQQIERELVDEERED